MLALGCAVYLYAWRLGGPWGGLLCLAVYVSTPAFLAFGPLVHTDLAVTLFSLLSLWTFAELWRQPNRRNVVLFGLSLAAALLSKFSAGILFAAFGAFALSFVGVLFPASLKTRLTCAHGGAPVGGRLSRASSAPRWRSTRFI